MAPHTKPNNTALGEPKPYTAAQSTAGKTPGRILLDIPWNDAVSSATNIRTPIINIARYTENINDFEIIYVGKAMLATNVLSISLK